MTIFWLADYLLRPVLGMHCVMGGAAQKVEEQFKGVMTKLDELAEQGHASAKMVLDSLQTASGASQKSGQ
jgi:hypothetical protein